MLIAFDGIDGSGKSTLAEKVNSYFTMKGIESILCNMGSYGFFDSHMQDIKKKSLLIP